MIVDGHNSKREQNGLTSSVTGPDDGVASPRPFGGYLLHHLLSLNAVAGPVHAALGTSRKKNMDLSIDGCWDCAPPISIPLAMICIGLIALCLTVITRQIIASKYRGVVKLLYGVTALWYALVTYGILSNPPFMYGYYWGQQYAEAPIALFPFGAKEILVVGWYSFSVALVLLMQRTIRRGA